MVRLSERFSPERIAKISQTLRRRRATRLDLLVPMTRIQPDERGRLGINLTEPLWKVGSFHTATMTAAESLLDDLLQEDASKVGELKIERVDPGPMNFRLNRKARSQLLSYLEVPVRYANKLAAGENSDLLWQLVRGLAERESEGCTRLFRCLDGEVRAVLSNKYRVLDSADVFFKTAEAIMEAGGELWEAKLFDDGFQMIGTHMGMSERVYDEKSSMSGKSSRGLGDEHYPLYSVGNDEAGGGPLVSNFGAVRWACRNGLFSTRSLMSIRHVGADIGKSAGERLILSQDTLASMVETDLKIVRDSVLTAFDPKRFKEVIDALQNAVGDQIPMEDPRPAVQAVIGHFSIPKEREDKILQSLLKNYGHSRYGLIQATTEQAHDVIISDPELARDLEFAGGSLTELDEDFHKWIDSGVKAYSAIGDEVPSDSDFVEA